MNKKELEQYKKILEVERRKLIGDINHIEKESLKQSQRDASGDLSGYGFHMADVATDNYDREFSLDLASCEQTRLNDIVDALEKIDDGTYGSCESCKKKISNRRLRAVPYARLCIKCKEQEEKKKSKRD
ncbi:MAG: TraR/DksA family transcriptional regulator [Candidatus Omnitrophica bacterium]|nr:TraR/DksA family transcriptional regulator [Candidatus Omnitrophota bacterium]